MALLRIDSFFIEDVQETSNKIKKRLESKLDFDSFDVDGLTIIFEDVVELALRKGKILVLPNYIKPKNINHAMSEHCGVPYWLEHEVAHFFDVMCLKDETEYDVELRAALVEEILRKQEILKQLKGLQNEK